MSKNRFNSDFDILVECINKRPEEHAEKLIKAEQELDRITKLVDRIYQSGDYSRLTEPLLRSALGLDELQCDPTEIERFTCDGFKRRSDLPYDPYK